jgi:hypothetical protein
MRALLLVFVGACAHVPPAPPPPAPVVVGCHLDKKPPTAPALPVVGPPACPPEFEACLRIADARELAIYLGEARVWMGTAWTECGPKQ